MPEWYQKGFWQPGEKTLAYLNLQPEAFKRSDGSTGYKTALHQAPPARAFVQHDLYSTFFAGEVIDEIERKLFGDIDTSGAKAVRAFAAGDPVECHQNFEALFKYIDIQKLRTPKGLAWLKRQYQTLTQNELMMEMQAIQMMHCTIWTEGVREIVSASDSPIKFIISDHPVTVFNCGALPGEMVCEFPNEPGIELKGTQTLFPLDRNHCLILTNLEYAEEPTTDPLTKRTFARRFRSSMVRTDALIRSRSLTGDQVEAFNRIIRSRAHKYVAAGDAAWLPEPIDNAREWKRVSEVLLPPSKELFHFGGETFVQYDSGHVHYQDAFGRTEKERDFLKKPPIDGRLKAGDPCGCGSGKAFANCCRSKRVQLRPTWNQLSIRERNLALFRGIENILEFRPDQDWTEVRKSITDEKISKIYSVYEALWPPETDLLSLLPKPDGTCRAVYTGMLDAHKITETGLGASLLFGELLIQHPFINPGTVKDDFNPVKNPQCFRQEVLKSVFFILQIMPLVEAGIVNLFPDPWDFDPHLREHTLTLAEARWRFLKPLIDQQDSDHEALASEEFNRSLHLLSEADQRAMLKRYAPKLRSDEIDGMLLWLQTQKEEDPFAVLQNGPHLSDGGQFSSFKLAPNFEMAMYVAQATGAAIITDHPMRWKEILSSIVMRGGSTAHHVSELAATIGSSRFSIAQRFDEIFQWWLEERPQPHRPVWSNTYRYLRRVEATGTKPNIEKRLAAEFRRAHGKYEAAITKSEILCRKVLIQCAFPRSGIYDSTISRLLLMSSSEHHTQSVPMAFFMDASPSKLP